MNEKAQQYWNKFWVGREQPVNVKAEQFGMPGTEMPDQLAQLIIDGVKTATCSNYEAYKQECEPIPEVGLYTIILNSKDDPVAIIKTTNVQIIPMNEVTPEFAAAEGEGDLSYEYWYNGHKNYFSIELAEYGKEFTEDMLLVCERFELVDVKAD